MASEWQLSIVADLDVPGEADWEAMYLDKTGHLVSVLGANLMHFF